MSETILITDNDSNRKNNTASRLRVSGYDVELATGGFHVIHLIEKHEFLCLIIFEDQHDMSGLEVLSLARTRLDKTTLPIIYVSKTSDKTLVMDAFEHGLNDFVTYSPQFYNGILEKIQKYQSKK
jgi:PleD family two-component response regulator